jgi:OOP family OmpA-OmpF porin
MRALKLTILAVLSVLPWAAQAEKGDWYVSPSVAYFDDDGDRLIDDGVAGGQIAVGREMSRHFALEGLLGYHDIDGFPGQKHLELGLNAIGNFRPEKTFSPYVLGGIGYLRADVGEPSFGGLPPAGDTTGDLTATAGLGLKIRLGDGPWALRTDWRLRREFGDDLTDQIGSVGIQYTFGGGAAAAPAAAAIAATAAGPRDTDNDGVVDADDLCPGTPRGVAVDENGCVPDSDGDGVTDDRDACPNTMAGVEVDSNGCEVIRPRPIYFDIDSAELAEQSKEKLDALAAVLKRQPGVTVDIAGFADSTGAEGYNLALSQRRAEAVRAYLEQAGIAASRLSAQGYGESRPTASNDTALGRFWNRRVELQALDR